MNDKQTQANEPIQIKEGFIDLSSDFPRQIDNDCIIIDSENSVISTSPKYGRRLSHVFKETVCEPDTKSTEYPSDFQNDIISENVAAANQDDINAEQRQKRKDHFCKTLYNLVHEEVFESGFENEADSYVQKYLYEDKEFTRACLNLFFKRYYTDDYTLIGLLQVISHLKHSEVTPEGPIMALASLSHDNTQVMSCGIRAFDNWASIDDLAMLRRTRCREQWLQTYLEQVICDIEEIRDGIVSKKV